MLVAQIYSKTTRNFRSKVRMPVCTAGAVKIIPQLCREGLHAFQAASALISRVCRLRQSARYTYKIQTLLPVHNRIIGAAPAQNTLAPPTRSYVSTSPDLSLLLLSIFGFLQSWTTACDRHRRPVQSSYSAGVNELPATNCTFIQTVRKSAIWSAPTFSEPTASGAV